MTVYEHADLAAKLVEARRSFYRKTFEAIDTDTDSWQSITGQDSPFYRRRQTCLDRIEQPHAILAPALDWYLAAKNTACGRSCGPLILFGSTGTGKTEAAMALLRELLLHGVSGMAVTAGDMMDSLRPGGNGDMNTLKTIGCLFVDDIAAEKSSDFTTARLFDIVNARYERQLPTIITTNRTPAGLARHVGERTWSRLKDGATPLSLTGVDRRVSKVTLDHDRPDIYYRLLAIGDMNACPNRPEMGRRIREAGIVLPLDARFDNDAAESINAICEAVEQEWTDRVETLTVRVKSWPNNDTRRRLWNASGTNYYESSIRTKPGRLVELERIADRVERQRALVEQITYLDDSPLDALTDLVRAATAAGNMPTGSIRRPLTDVQLDLLESFLRSVDRSAASIFAGGAAEKPSGEA